MAALCSSFRSLPSDTTVPASYRCYRCYRCCCVFATPSSCPVAARQRWSRRAKLRYLRAVVLLRLLSRSPDPSALTRLRPPRPAAADPLRSPFEPAGCSVMMLLLLANTRHGYEGRAPHTALDSRLLHVDNRGHTHTLLYRHQPQPASLNSSRAEVVKYFKSQVSRKSRHSSIQSTVRNGFLA